MEIVHESFRYYADLIDEQKMRLETFESLKLEKRYR